MILPVLAEPEWSERMTPEDLRALTPLIDVHVTPYGTFHLDLETQWSLEPWPRRRKRDAAKRGIPMSTVYTLIIPNPARTHVFVVGPEPHWTLPEVVFEQPYFWQVVGPINAAVRARFSLEVTTLRCRSVLHDAPHAQTRLVYELEYHGTTEPGAVTGRWLGAEAVDHLPLDQRPILAAWFGEARCLTSAGGRVPWYRPGWRDTMLAWLHRTLNQVGRTLTGAVEQVRSWERASLWRAPTNREVVYVKAVPPMFGHEPALTALLAEHFPTRIPPVLAFDPVRRWLLMAEAGSQPLIAYPEIERWEGALRDYAGMQRVLAYHVDALHAVGVPYRGVPWLRSGLARLLADTGTLTRGQAGLSPDEIVTLRAREPELEAACTTWERSGVPISLEHGDFSAWQVQIDGASSPFLDWSDSSVAPPFFSLLGVLADSTVGLPSIPNAASRLRDAYLSGWSELASPRMLQQMFELAQRLAPLHHALIYYLDILPSMEQRWEMEPMLPYYLRMLL